MFNDEPINGFHAHIYYTNQEEKSYAGEIRSHVEQSFDVVMGRWRDEPVGPHPVAMYQIAFKNDVFDSLVPWLMMNRKGLSILVHPNTSDMVKDHRDFPLWLGEKLDLNIAFLEAGNKRA